jgi:hypothetical protein
MLLFIMIVFITKQYSNNMVIVLLSAIVGTNILASINIIYSQEGMSTSRRTPKAKAIKDVQNDEDVPVIDSEDTKNTAFASLQDLIGKDGVDGLSLDTDNLMSKQKVLSESMDAMVPLIDKANKLVGSINTDQFDKISGLFDRFKPKV